MRLLIGLLAAAGLAGLAGCAAYDDGYASTGVYYGTTTYAAPAYGYYSYNAPVYVAPLRRDRDGDGVPDVYDRHPDNSRRY